MLRLKGVRGNATTTFNGVDFRQSFTLLWFRYYYTIRYTIRTKVNELYTLLPRLPSLHASAAQSSRAAVRLSQYTSPHTQPCPDHFSVPSAWKCARPRLQYNPYPREARTARSSSRSHHDLISARASVEYQLVERVWVTATRTLRAAGTWVDRNHRLCLDHAQGRRARSGR